MTQVILSFNFYLSQQNLVIRELFLQYGRMKIPLIYAEIIGIYSS